MVQWRFPQAQFAPPTPLNTKGLDRLGDIIRGQQQEEFRRQQIAEAQQYRQQRDAVGDQRAERTFGLEERRFGATQAHRDRTFNAAQPLNDARLGLFRAQAESARRVPAAGMNADLRRQKLELEIQRLRDGDPLKAAKTRLLESLMGQQGQAPTGSPPPATLQPQSNETVPRDPNFIPAQAAAPDGAPAPQPPLQSLTPAQRQGMALNLIAPGLGNALIENDKGEKFGTATRNKVEGKLFDTTEGMTRLSGIQKSFRPEFLTFEGGIKAGWLGFMDKVRAGRANISEGQRKYLQDFTAFKQDSWDNLNRYIKEITGAQMSEAEAARLMRAMPNPGTSFWDGDSPTEFKAKMNRTVGQLKLAAARYNYLRSARFKSGGAEAQSNISLQQMRGVINKRAMEIARELRRANPGVDGQLIQAQADRATAKEFGI